MQGDSVKGLRMEYLGKKVLYGGKAYTVVEVGQDGELLINRPSKDSEVTAISTAMCKLAE